MHIFIDESGSFIHPTRKANLVSCVTALVIPDNILNNVLTNFQILKRKWKVSGELKGNKISEAQAQDLITMLSSFEIIVVSECIDMGLHSAEEIDEHKKQQANAFEKPITGPVTESLQAELNKISEKVGKSANQLYVQSCLLKQVCSEVIRKTTLYYSQFLPSELGSFSWVLDSKGSTFEELWKTTVLPALQSIFLREPMIACTDYDYSYYDQSFKYHKDEIPDHLAPYLKEGVSEIPTDIKKLMTDNLKFLDSKNELGLQLVDLVASIITRSCNETLQAHGWNNIGKLFLQAQNGSHPLGFVMLNAHHLDPQKLPYNEFFKAVWRKARHPFKD